MWEHYEQDLDFRRNKFFSLPSKNQSKLINLQILRSSRHTKESQIAKQMEQKIKQRYLPALHSGKTFHDHKQQAENDLYAAQMVRENSKLQALIKKLHLTFIHYRIPDFYAFYFFKRLKNLKESSFQDAIVQEMNWIKERQCHYHFIESSVQAREGCLKQLSKSLQKLQKSPDEDSTYREFREQIIHYRRLTALVIKQIKQWKDYLVNLSEQDFEQHPAFIFREEDYLLTLLNDNIFVFNSFLSKYSDFNHKNDPFFLKPHTNRLKEEKYTSLFAVNQQEKNQYIVLLNYLAQERAKYLKGKILVKRQRIKDISKIYHSKNNFQQLRSTSIFVRPQHSLNLNLFPNTLRKTANDYTNNFQYDMKRSVVDQKEKRLQAMRHLKKMITSSNGTHMMPKNKLSTIQQSQLETQIAKMRKTLVQYPIKTKSDQNNYEEDFSQLLRRKQMQVMEQAKDMKDFKWRNGRTESNYANYGTPIIRMSRSSSFRTIKIKDSLSKEHRTLNNKSCLNQLQSILSTLETTAPLELTKFKLNRRPVEHQQNIIESPSETETNFRKSIESTSPNNLKKLNHINPSLIQHNDEVMSKTRNKILKEIEDQKTLNLPIQMIKKLQNQRVQAVLHQKIQKQAFKHINQDKNKRHQGREEIAKNFKQQELFGYNSQTSTSKQLTQLEKQLKKEFQLRLLREVNSQLKTKTQISDIQLHKIQPQQILTLEARRVSEKQERQKRFVQIEREQRAKAIKHVLELEAKRKQELQQEMQRIIQEQKQKLQLFTLTTSKQLNHELKQQVKQNMLKQLQYQKDLYLQEQLTQEEINLRQEQYRRQVRNKLIQQYQIQQIVDRQHQRQEKVKKQKILSQKFQHFDDLISKKDSNISPPPAQDVLSYNDKVIIQTHHQTLAMQEARERLIRNPSLPQETYRMEKYKVMQEQEKLKMRQQFEVQLYSFLKDENLNLSPAQKQFKVKDIQSFSKDPQLLKNKQLNLKKEIELIQEKEQGILIEKEEAMFNIQKEKQPRISNNKKENQKISSPEKQPFRGINHPQTYIQTQNVLKQLKRNQTQSSAFENFSQSMTLQELKNQTFEQIDQNNHLQSSQNVDLKIQKSQTKNHIKPDMTVEELEIYNQKKRVIDKNKKSDELLAQKEKFVKRKKTLKKVFNEFELVEFSRNTDQQESFQPNKKQVDSIFEQGNRSQKQKSNQKKMFIFSNKTEVNSQNRSRGRRSQKSSSQKDITQYPTNQILFQEIKTEQIGDFDFSNNESQVIKLTVNSQMSNSVLKRNDKFLTSEEQGFESGRSFRKRRSERGTKNQFNQARTKKQADNKSSSSESDIVKLINNQVKKKQESQDKQMFFKVLKINNQKLEEFMKNHFEHLPRLIKRLNLYKRDELVKLLREDYKSFSIVECIQNNVSLGVGIVSLNEKKKALRSFNILHIGSYQESGLFKLLKNCSEYLFKNDPVEEITLSLFYYSDVQDQMKFIKKFEKDFADSGVMFQKNIFDTQFERKLVMRRNISLVGLQQKEKVNCGSFWIQNDLIVAQEFIGIEAGQFQKAGANFGCYGIVSIYLAQNLTQQQLKNLIGQEKQQGNTINQNIKNLANQSASFQPSIEKICDGQGYKSKKFENAFEMNLELHKLTQPLIKFQSQFQDKPISCIWSSMYHSQELNYFFTNQRMKFKYEDDEYVGEYFRFVAAKTSKKKTYEIKSKLYSSSITVMPCKDNRYRIFVLSSEEYDNIAKENRLNERNGINLDSYIKLFFANIEANKIYEVESIWLPQFKSKREYNCEQILKPFQPQSESTLKSSMQYYYTTYLENSLIFEPSHRDLVITPPFILGVIDSQMQLASEGASLVVKRFSLEDMVKLTDVPKIIDED